jgi:hypothetical protein
MQQLLHVVEQRVLYQYFEMVYENHLTHDIIEGCAR